MTVEARIAALEARLQAAEDQLAIIRLINSYGPAADSGSNEAAVSLWTEDGAYDVGDLGRMKGHDELIKIYESSGHQQVIRHGSAHLTATPRIMLDGDYATAVAYAFLIARNQTGSGYDIARASACHWTLSRTSAGWRIVERRNRLLDGSAAARAVLLEGVSQ